MINLWQTIGWVIVGGGRFQNLNFYTARNHNSSVQL